MNVLMSIQTKYARKIFIGEKLWEFRKNTPKWSPLFPSKIVVYSAGVDKAIIGEFTIKRVVKTDFDSLMEITKSSKDGEAVKWFKNYYKGGRICCAIEVGEIIEYETPIPLTEIQTAQPNFRAPQNFYYLEPMQGIIDLVNKRLSMLALV